MKQTLLTFFILSAFLSSAQFKSDDQNPAVKKQAAQFKNEQAQKLKSSSVQNSQVQTVGSDNSFSDFKASVIAGSKEYDDLKLKGTLGHYEIKINNQGKPVVINPVINRATTTSSPTPCDPIPYIGTNLTYPGSFSSPDDATAAVALPFTFCFYGTNYTSCNISINGNIQFSTNSTAFTSTGFPSTAVNMIAPFWADCYLTPGTTIKYDIFPTRIVVSWDSMGYYSNHNNLLNSFQCVLTNGLDVILPPGKNVGFYYRNMQWTTGDASSGTGGFPNPGISSPATVGANQGNGVDYFLIGRFGVPGSVYDGPLGNDDGINWLNGKQFFFNVCPAVGSNQEPVSALIGYCDTLKVCGNDTLFIKNTFLAPEVTQSTAVTASCSTLGSSFSYTNVSSGNTADIFMIVDGNTAPNGYHTITMSATDNGVPPLTSVQSFVVYVNQSAVNNLNGTIVLTPTLGACPGGAVTASVSVSGGAPDSYQWSNNVTTSSTTYTTVVPADSLIFVTLQSGQCKKTITGDIKINPVPVAAITGNLTYCNGVSALTPVQADNTYTAGNQAPYTYSWYGSGYINNPSGQFTNVSAGTYTVVITNQYGCVSSATTTVTQYESPSYSLTTNAISGGSVYCVTQDTARIAFHYATSSVASCGLGNTNCVISNNINVGTGVTGNSNFSYPSPYGNYDKNNRQQYLYTAAELTAAGLVAGNISSISFTVNSINPLNTTYTSNSSTYIGTLPNYSIKLKCVPITVFPNTTFDNTGLNQVFLGNVTPTVGVNTQNFSQPYIWDGVSNLLVDICYTRTVALGSTYYTSNPVTPYTNVAANRTRIFNSDGIIACGYATANSLSNFRPNIRFGNCLAQQQASQFNVAVTPTLGVVIPAGKDSIKIDLPNVSSITCYTITVTNPIGGCVKDTVICINNNLGIVNATFAVNIPTVCIGSPVILTAGSADTYTISYMQSGAPVQLTTNSTYTHVPVQAGINTYILSAGANCTTVIKTYTVTVNVLPLANLTIAPLVDQTKCMDKPFVITTGVNSTTAGNSGTPYSYNWSLLPGNTPAPGTNTGSTYTVNSNNTSTLVVVVSGNCATSASDTVIVKNFVNNLHIAILDSSTACANSTFTLHAQATGGYGGTGSYYYSWYLDPNQTSLSNTAVLSYTSPPTQGTYTVGVYVGDSCGYSAADYQIITVLPPCDLVIPNIITPNGDNVNDVFIIKNLEFHPNTNLTIFDRWGRKIYDTSNYDNKWKAEGLSDGTYFYTLTLSDDDKKYSGFITVFHSK